MYTEQKQLTIIKIMFRKGYIPWNKGLKGYLLGRKMSLVSKLKLSIAKKGKPNLITLKRNFENNPGKKGSEHWHWKGGNSRGYKTGYYSTEYKKWRQEIFKRDNFICQKCLGKRGQYITAHHIKSFTHFPELRFVLDNGITLCEKCHSETDNYRGKAIKKNKK